MWVDQVFNGKMVKAGTSRSAQTRHDMMMMMMINLKLQHAKKFSLFCSSCVF